MVGRSTALRLFALVVLGVLIAQPVAAQSFPVFGYILQNGTIDNSVNVASTVTSASPSLEYIAVDGTGHPLKGIPETFQPKYDEGFQAGYGVGYASGFTNGQRRGTSAGTADGRSDGYNKGWDDAYQPAFDSAYSGQLPFGQAAGWKQGLVDGFEEGYLWAPTLSGFLTGTNNGHGHGNGIYGFSGSITISSGAWSGNNLVSTADPPAFYYKLGYDDGNESGLSAGSTEGYNLTYPGAYATAYPIGYQNGTIQGTLQGTSDGSSEGFSAGWDFGYDRAYDYGFGAGVQYHLFGAFTLPSYGDVFGEPMSSVVPEPAGITLLSCALVVGILRRSIKLSRAA
jgi:hypothetical protein